jgi:hypothetical protein
MGKKSSTHNIIIGAMELEEEQSSRLKGSEYGFSGWLPKVDFVWGRREGREVVEPSLICNAYEKIHDGCAFFGTPIFILLRSYLCLYRKLCALFDKNITLWWLFGQ